MVNILNTIRPDRGARLFGLAFILLLPFVSLFAQQGSTGVCQGGVTDAETHTRRSRAYWCAMSAAIMAP